MIDYRGVLRDGLDRMSQLVEEFRHIPLAKRHHPEVARLLHLSGFLGFQKVTNLVFWLEDFLDEGTEDSVTHFRDEGCWHLLLDKIQEILKSVEVPDSYGEFVKPSGVTLRPLFSREVDLMGVFERLKRWHPVVATKRHIYKLPMAVVSDYSYTLRVPSRYMTQFAREPVYLTLVYLDLCRQVQPWHTYAQWVQEQSQREVILYQGALEIPYDDLHRKHDVLPYYLLLKTQQPPKAFLVQSGLRAQIMVRIKEPDTALTPLGTEEEDLPEGQELPAQPVQPLETIGEPMSGVPDTQIPPRMEPSEFAEESAAWNMEAEPIGTSHVAPLDFPVVKESRTSPLIIRETLSLIPFTLDDLDRPDASWPVGLDGVEIRSLRSERTAEDLSQVREEEFVLDEPVVSTPDTTPQETKPISETPELADRWTPEEKSRSPWKGLAIVVLLLSLGILGGGGWVGWKLYQEHLSQRIQNNRDLLQSVASALEYRVRFLASGPQVGQTSAPELIAQGQWSQDRWTNLPPELSSQVLDQLRLTLKSSSAGVLINQDARDLLYLVFLGDLSESPPTYLVLDRELLLQGLLDMRNHRNIQLVSESALTQARPGQTLYTRPLTLGSLTLVLEDKEGPWRWPWEAGSP